MKRRITVHYEVTPFRLKSGLPTAPVQVKLISDLSLIHILMAQIAANNVGEKRFGELCDEMGIDVVLEAVTELEKYCDRRMAAELEKLPAGIYEFEDSLEGDGITTEEPLQIKVAVTTGGPKIKIDFTGTCPQVRLSLIHI